ncbi:hypothetical protein [Brachyspira intermedia]|uniref:hypothetical protein n=1 Tax=Brachyspira intermedia TaxID=84377 RepID=UPI003003A9B5
MPLPVIAIVGIAIGGALALIGVGGIVFYQVDKNAPADLTILLIGEKEAGKDTLFHVLKGDGFLKEHNVILNYETIMAKVKTKTKKIKIKIINTTGSESSLKDTEEAKSLHHDIRCYVFDSRKFYSNDNVVKLGIKDSINDCMERNIILLTIGTRGDEVNNKEDIENEVKSFGSNCKIFELSKNPREDLIKYIFKI